MEEYAKNVAKEAAEYQNSNIKAINDEIEKHHYDEMPEEGMVQLDSKIRLGRSNLIQLDADINMEPEADMALSLLINQFPEEYESKEDKQKKIKEPTEKEKMAQEKKEMIEYAQSVAQEAADYNNKLKKEEEEKEEKKHLMDEYNVQLESTVKAPIQNKNHKVNLAQVKNKSLEENELVQSLSKAGLTEE